MKNTEIEVEKEVCLLPQEAFLPPWEAILPFLTILSPGCKIALLVLSLESRQSQGRHLTDIECRSLGQSRIQIFSKIILI